VHKRRIQYEQYEQIAFFEWARFYQFYDYLYHVPNGGQRNIREGARLKKMGVKAGILDINLDYGNRGYHGLRIELKVRKGKISSLQQGWLDRLNKVGYHAVVVYGWEKAKDIVLWYLKDTDLLLRK